MNKVYIVTDGDHICRVFSTHALASEFMKTTGLASDIEEFLIDVPRERWTYVSVRMHEDGTLHGKPEKTVVDEKLADIVAEYPPRPLFWGRPFPRTFVSWNVMTDDVDKAVKVVAEKVATLVSIGAWGNNDLLWKLWGQALKTEVEKPAPHEGTEGPSQS